MNLTNKKCLIAYYSRKGKNYVSGRIVDLKVGNTEVVANMIQKITGGDMFPIESVTAYPNDYTETTEVAKNELRAKARPNLTRQVENIARYDMIFLGYPNWWGTMPMPVHTFLRVMISPERKSFPFAPTKAAAWATVNRILPKHVPRLYVLKGIAIHGTTASSANSNVSSWIDELSIWRS